ncbi:hypothetical protein PIB30_042847 [Stylosanthes scabra]|uniref:Uncharacterized protein n=1 Tax=Stylosanthes scabra TaxID=79078 RepID=A0ABU6XFN0_9FABA|nr:hypothetical protein [Stylosanthes scabra]
MSFVDVDVGACDDDQAQENVSDKAQQEVEVEAKMMDYDLDDDDYSADSDLNFNDSEDDYCGDDPLFDVDVTLEETQQEVRQKKNAKPAKRKGKHVAERISSGMSDEEGINSDELNELDSEEDEQGGGVKRKKFPLTKS